MSPDLFPYQDEGAAFLASKRRAALFDDPGVGKTAQAIRALDAVRARRCVIVCPAAVREVWLGEFKKFGRLPRKILKGKDINDLNLWLRGKADVLLLSYQMARTWAKRMEGDVFDAIVFDECHYLKNKATDWTRAMLGAECDGKYGLARWAARAWFLSGTPAPNDAADVWSVMRFCKATPCSHRIFTDRYFRKRVGTYSTSHTVREEMVPELKLAIKSFSLRPYKEAGGPAAPADLADDDRRRRRLGPGARSPESTPEPRGCDQRGRREGRAVIPGRAAHRHPATSRRYCQSSGVYGAAAGGA